VTSEPNRHAHPSHSRVASGSQLRAKPCRRRRSAGGDALRPSRIRIEGAGPIRVVFCIGATAGTAPGTSRRTWRPSRRRRCPGIPSIITAGTSTGESHPRSPFRLRECVPAQSRMRYACGSIRQGVRPALRHAPCLTRISPLTHNVTPTSLSREGNIASDRATPPGRRRRVQV
jgi:hypothetical protein